MAQRIKGQEVDILIVANGIPSTAITDVRSFSAEFQFEASSEGYLGEATNRRDDIFNGC